MPVTKNSIYLLFIIFICNIFSILILSINRNIIILNCDNNQFININIYFHNCIYLCVIISYIYIINNCSI